MNHAHRRDEMRKSTLCGNMAMAFSPITSFGRPGRVHFAGGDHSGDSAVHVAVDPAELVLARRPVAGHRMHMAVDQSRHHRRALGINHQGRVIRIDIFLFADG